VSIPGHGEDKINHAYAYGGVELALKTVQGFLNVPIRYYVKIDVTGFVRLVDALGGVPIDVEKDMDWDDNAGNLHIHLKKGPQTLDGKNASDYVRFRHTDSDMARAARQQKFIAAAIKQVLKPSNLLKIPELMRIGFQTVQTNIPLPVALRYAPAVSALKDNPASYTVEGEDKYINGIYYYVPDMDKLEELVETYFYSGIDRTANQGVKVVVRYGNGSRASGDQVAQALRKSGFNVLSVTAADRSDYQVTQVLSTKKETAGAVSVAEAIAAPEVLLDLEAGTGTGADVIVIIGKDMQP
jgi:LCP family protein required for cell wall assembly